MQADLDSAPGTSILRSGSSALTAAAIPCGFAATLYLAVASVFMPIRYQLGFRPSSIFPGGGPAWIDLGVAFAFALLLGLVLLPSLRKTARVVGRSTLGLLLSQAFSPTYTLVGRWFWEPAAASMFDTATGGSRSTYRIATVSLLISATLASHAALVLLLTVIFSLPVWITHLSGDPATMPCILIWAMGSPNGVIRVKCDPLPLGQWYDEDALYFFGALFLAWAVLSIVLGCSAMIRSASAVRRYQ